MVFGNALILIATFSIIFIEATSPFDLMEDKCLAFSKSLLHQGTIPCKIAHQLSKRYFKFHSLVNYKLQQVVQDGFLLQ